MKPGDRVAVDRGRFDPSYGTVRSVYEWGARVKMEKSGYHAGIAHSRLTVIWSVPIPEHYGHW